MSSNNNNNNNNNNKKQPLDLTKSLPVATGGLTMEDNVRPRSYRRTPPPRGSFTREPAPHKKLGIPKIKKSVATGIPSQPVDGSITDVKSGKKSYFCFLC
ncbi:hypothetical protein Tco_0091152 [Tanacetum coccineum]